MGGIPNRPDSEGKVRPCVAIKIDQKVVDRARVIAAYKKISLSDYLSDTLDPCIDRDFDAMVEDMGKSKKPKPDGDNGKDGGDVGGPDRPDRPGKPDKPDRPDRKGPSAGPGPGPTDDTAGPAGPVAHFSEGQGLRPARPDKPKGRHGGDGLTKRG